MNPTRARAGWVRPSRRPGMLRAHDDLRSHRGDRERPPALRRRPPAPHRPPLPGQARRRRRRPARHVRRVRRRGEPGRARAGRPRPAARATGSRCCRTTAGSSPSGRSPPRSSAWCSCRSTSCWTARGDRLHPAALRRARDRRRGRAGADGGEGAGRRPGSATASAAGSDWPARRHPTAGRTSTAGGATAPTERARTSLVADDDPLRLMYTSGTESRPKGVMLSSRSLISQYVSCVDRRRDERRRRRGARAADVPLRAAGLLLLRRRLPRRDQRHPARARPGRAARDDRAGAGHEAVLPADRVDLAAAPPRLRHATDLSSLRKGYYGASPMPVEVLRELQRRLPDVALWNFYGQTEMAPLATILRPHEQLDTGGLARAGRRSTSRRRVVDDDGEPVPAGHDRRDRAPQPARGAGLLRGRGEDRRGVRAAAGSTPATWGC